MATFLDLDLDIFDSVIAEYTSIEEQLLGNYSIGRLSAIRSWLCLEWRGAGSAAWSTQYNTFINAVVEPTIESLTQLRSAFSRHYETAVEMRQKVSSLIATFPGLTGFTPYDRKLYYNGSYDTNLVDSCTDIVESLTKLESVWDQVNETLGGLTSGSISLHDGLTRQGLFFRQCIEVLQFKSNYENLRQRFCEFEATVNADLAPFNELPSIRQDVLSLSPIDQISLEASRDGRIFLSSDFQYIYYKGEIFHIGAPDSGGSLEEPVFSPCYQTIETPLEINGPTSVNIGILTTRSLLLATTSVMLELWGKAGIL